MTTNNNLEHTQSLAKAGLPQFQFGDFTFDLGQDELKQNQSLTITKLEPQVSQLLHLFVTHPGEVLSKTYLQETLWPNTIVEQNSLYQLLTKIRRLLNDSSRSPKYIKTLPKKGYCFIATVSLVVEETKPQAHTEDRALLPSTAPNYLWLWLVPALIVCFSAYAFFSRYDGEPPVPHYELQDVSYDLGLESDVDVHITEDLIAYVKDIYSLQIANKQGEVLHQLDSPYRVAFPTWQRSGSLLAYWRYKEDQCELFIMTPQGAQNHQAPSIACESAIRPVWKNTDELVLSVWQKGQLIPYLYRISQQDFVKLPLAIPRQSLYKGAVKAWNSDVFYLLNHANHTSSLIKLNGERVMNWGFPVWLAAYNPHTQAIISNDSSQRHALVATHVDGRQYEVFQTAQGLFTNVSIDQDGDIYTAIESWQVNIRDKDQLPIFSTSSIDYLPVSNRLGETAFMSRRSGVCEVYLHADDQVVRLSHHKGYEYVQFLEWRPDLSMLLSNRDLDLALYDRQGQVLQFTTELNEKIRNIGWFNNDTVFAFDGHQLHFYNLQGHLTHSQTLDAQLVYFDVAAKRWLVLKNRILYSHDALENSGIKLAELSNQQSNLLHNIRLKNNTLYWQSSWSKQDYIWRLPLIEQSQVEMVKQGNLIWHFDISPYEELTIAKMEALEGDIKRLAVVTAP
ncbi:cholera toxin transcriptional activator [Pseudoalteromonas ulvae UL12]|uniref:winged helix-turn-helix domain-containing protein n=1 Tax=Pseudoalteromonas ulvae TaxID=107327 RepID=UPI00186B78DD|nr:transcriptional regulator [Pseudoalteromonas ulvae]MBE0364623.1 cholera toxin transcriptional activator [Pseudoalteromonas ulvae UL12]